MERILSLVEGPTEERFVQDKLNPYLLPKEIFLIPVIIRTKRIIGGPDYKGGVKSYNQVKGDLLRLFNDTNAKYITSMIDYYSLPNDFPSYAERTGSAHQKVEFLEEKFMEDINRYRFIPYLQLHEFEALLFSSDEAIAKVFFNRDKELEKIQEIIDRVESPEEIDEGRTTAPSKRFLTIFPEYRKVLHSTLISRNITIDEIRLKCPHFNSWLNKLEN